MAALPQTRILFSFWFLWGDVESFGAAPSSSVVTCRHPVLLLSLFSLRHIVSPEAPWRMHQRPGDGTGGGLMGGGPLRTAEQFRQGEESQHISCRHCTGAYVMPSSPLGRNHGDQLEKQGPNRNRKRRYAGVFFTRFCDLWFSVCF